MKKIVALILVAVLGGLLGGGYIYLNRGGVSHVQPAGARIKANQSSKASPIAVRETVIKSDLSEGYIGIDEILSNKVEEAIGASVGSDGFDLATWRAKYCVEHDIKSWNKRNPPPWRGWVSWDDPKCGGQWYINLGPLGVRTLMHDKSWLERKGFAAHYPKCLSDNQGLLLNCFEVLEVKPGSPAEGHLKKGDLIIAIDRHFIKTATDVAAPQDIDRLSERGLEYHAGLLIDKAEGRGKIRLQVVRPLSGTIYRSKPLRAGEISEPVSLRIRGGRRLRLVVKNSGSGAEHGAVNWVSPEFHGSYGTKKLSEMKWSSATAWQNRVQNGRDCNNQPLKLNGQPVKNVIGAYADSVVEYNVPDGTETITFRMQHGDRSRGSVVCSVEIEKYIAVKNPPRAWEVLQEQSFLNPEERKHPMRVKLLLKAMQSFAIVGDDNGGNGNDHFLLENVVLQGKDGQKIRLSQLKTIKTHNGYGRVEVDENTHVWKVHAPFRYEFEIPKGTWVLTGTVRPEQHATIIARIEAIRAGRLNPAIRKYIKTVEFDIPRLGSFGQHYTVGCAKGRNLSAVMAAALASYQQKDGRWTGVSTYTTDAFHTSVCGLALMSTDNPDYKDNIRRAAYYVAYGDNTVDNWSYPRGTQLMFLSEYYLRTHDKGVLPGLKRAVKRAMQAVLIDYTCGHGIGAAGYGGYGYIGSGSNVACGLALADKCGMLNGYQVLVLDKMLQRAQQLAVGGTMPYGRMGSRTDEISRGHALGCSTGMWLPAALLRGGADKLARRIIAHYSRPPFGGADGGHATQTIHFTWGALAIAICGDEAYARMMDTFRWKFVTYREYDGLANRNNCALEYHNADGVIGSPFWRTAGYILILNAWRHNLAITGKRDYYAKNIKVQPAVYSPDKTTQNYVLRNWFLAEAVMQDAAPASFRTALDEIINLPPSKNLGINLLKLLERRLPGVLKDIAAIQGIDDATRMALLQQVSGCYLKCSITAPKPNDKSGEIEIKAELLSFARIYKERVGKVEENFPVLNSEGTIRIKARRASVVGSIAPVELKSLAAGGEKSDAVYKFKSRSGEQPVFQLDFTGKVAGVDIEWHGSWRADNQTTNLVTMAQSSLRVRGRIIEDIYPQHAACRILLDSGRIIGCESKPETMLAMAGGHYELTISPDTIWGGRILTARPLEKNYRLAIPDKVSIVDNQLDGPVEKLIDGDLDTAVTCTEKSDKLVLELEYSKPVTVGSGFVLIPRTAWWVGSTVLYEYEKDGKWQKIVTGNQFGIDYFPEPVSATKFRLTLKAGNLGDRKIYEMDLFKPLAPELRRKLRGVNW